MKERIIWIDMVKGVALLLVMLSHFGGMDYPWLFTALFCGYMAPFYILPGYVNRPSTSLRSAISSKAKRLLIPYAFYGIVGIATCWCINRNISVTDALVGLCYGRWSMRSLYAADNVLMLGSCPPIGPLWFLPSLFLSFVCLAVYDHFQKKTWAVGALVCTAILSTYKPFLLPWSLDTVPVTTLLLILGREMASRIAPTQKVRPLHLALAIVVSATIYYALCYMNGFANLSVGHYGNRPRLSLIIYLALGISETALLCSLCMAWSKGRMAQALAYTGRHSLRLMCMHWVVFYIASALLPACPIPAIIAVALVATYVLDYIIEQIVGKGQASLPVCRYI